MVFRKAIYLSFSLAALFAVVMMAVTANAQTDPFGALYTPPGGAPPTSNKVGSTGVTTHAAGSYASAETSGFASLAQISMLPKAVAPLNLKVKEWNGKYLNRTRRVAVPTYSLALVRTGKISAFAGGTGSAMVSRKTTVSTVLMGVSDELAAQLADEAHADLLKKLAAAGFEVIPTAELLAEPNVAGTKTYPTPFKFNENTVVYSPRDAPLRAWAPFTPPLAAAGTSIAYGKATKPLDAIILSPGIQIDYQKLEGSGQRMYSGKAYAEAEVHFGVGAGSGANLIVWPAPPYKGGWPSSMLMEKPSGSNEPFAIMYEIDDRSDSIALQRAFAQLGSNMYRQSKYYAVEVDPGRYAALTRAAFQGLNTAIVAELKKKHGI